MSQNSAENLTMLPGVGAIQQEKKSLVVWELESKLFFFGFQSVNFSRNYLRKYKGKANI
jgi:hypothetical protein